ncbi:DUF805 domain-containing protein [Erysipelothrix sp. HDW6B]|uniref:DUF805 domain-containing protein n=1 Tax=Erysipelothrix TaxID=1647 RepID=UPI001358F637|nr:MULTISPECIES: DUF805 domain-containing protein [Erysipelothrix]QIK85337.1 DUF805 domain-containing protein [Erysipelothrix sp. HDW6B]
MNYLKKFVANMAIMDGRTSRREFWFTILYIYLFAALFGVAVGLIGLIVKLPTLLGAAIIVIQAIIFIGTISMQVRRLHDTNKSAWYLLVNMIPVIGQFVFIFFLVSPGDDHMNNYGYPNNSQETTF